MRITRLRDANGVTWYVRNGEIIRIGNRSQGFATAIVDGLVAAGVREIVLCPGSRSSPLAYAAWSAEHAGRPRQGTAQGESN